jgi:DNA-binding NtrC family response regulator
MIRFMSEVYSSRKIRVLIVEDSEEDTELALRHLRLAGFDPEWRRVETQRDYLAQLDASIDIVLSDYQMPQFDGPKALRLLQERGWDIPFLIVSGTIGEERAVAAIKSGADDYLVKDRMARLGSAVTQALERRRARQERKRLEGGWQSAEDKFRRLVEHSLVGIYVIQDGK